MTAGLELTPGTLIDGRYRIQRILGRGGFGRTYLAADDRRFGDLCVLKEFAPSNQSDPVVAQKLRELFQREATTLHKLNHPQIPRFIAVFDDAGRLFIAQEYINGKTYWRVLQERQQQGRAFSEAEIVQWLKDLLRVLDYLHGQHIVHRDIAPDNIMLPKNGKLPVLIDFGVVKQVATHFYGMSAMQPDGLIQASVSVGKFGYAPYEQIRMGQCSPKSDLYALAVTAVVLLTGKPPNFLIDARSLEWQWQSQVRLNPRLVEILERMMAEKPQDRYASARMILRDLQFLNRSASSHLQSSSNQSHPSHHVKYGSSSILTASNLNHTALKLVSPPHEFSSRNQAAVTAQPQPREMTAAMSSLQTTSVEPVHAQTPVQVATKLLSSPDQTELQSYTEVMRSSFYSVYSSLMPEFAANRSTVMPITMPPRTTSKVLVQQPWQPLLQLKTILTLGLLALLPLGGIVVGARSPYIASVCQVLDNCVGDEQSKVRYQRAVEQAAGAKVLSQNARNLADLQRARDRLVDSLAQLGSFSGNTKIYAEAQQVLLSYRSTLKSLETNLEKETRATQLLQRAEAEAQKAIELTKTAKTVQAYGAAALQWQRAVDTLQRIQPGTFIAGQVAARLQEYNARWQAVSLHLPEPERKQHELALSQHSEFAEMTQAGLRSPQPQTVSAQSSQPSLQPRPSQTGSSRRPSQRTTQQPTSSPRSSLPKPARTPQSSRRTPPSSVQAIAPRSALSASPIVRAPSSTLGNRALQAITPLVPRQPVALAPEGNRLAQAFSAGNASLSAFQTLNRVSLELDGAWINSSGTYVANLLLENGSDRPFGFVPLFAEVRDANGRPVQSRILLRDSEDGVVEPGETLRGQLYLLDRRWNGSGTQNLTLVVREGTSGSRNFHLAF